MVGLGLCGCGVTLKDKNTTEEVELKELIVEKEYSLPVPLAQSQQQVLRIEKLVLKPGAQFITQGLNLKLEITELVSENATIRSFKVDQTAQDFTTGRSGGQLELSVGRVVGTLSVEMRGERGGRGRPGPAADASLKGPTGVHGMDTVWTSSSRGSGSLTLIISGTDGAPGGSGAPGFPGLAGMRGGDSGRAYLKIADSSDANIQIDNIAGLGGDGGNGGPGGEGGEGGEAGGCQGPVSCPIQSPGPRGAQGPQGPQGPIGPSGLSENHCIESDTKSLTCEAN